MEMERQISKAGGGSSNPPVLELEEEEEVTLPGFRFRPTDEELVGFYLPRKLKKKRLRIDIIKQVDIYKHDPWDLAKQSTVGVEESEWYFFCPRGRKYRNSVRPNRVTGSGYWKATGIDKKIIFPDGTNNCIGLKKSLVYYCGKGGKGTKTNWMMHEFRLPLKEISDDLKSIGADEDLEAENWTICKIFKRIASSSSPKKSRQVKNTPIPNDQNSSPTSPLADESIEVVDQDGMYQSEPSSVQPLEDLQQVNMGCQEEQDPEGLGQLDYNLMFDDFPLLENPDSRFCVFGSSLEELDYMKWEEIERVLEIQVDPEVSL